jgi:ABC-2 type transport system permease protein
VLVAKAGLVAVLTLGAATAGVLGSLLVARVLLPRHGFTRAHGVPPLSLTDPAVLRATVGSILYLVLVALLSLGVAAVVREPVAAAGTALGLLYLLGAAPFVIASPVWQRRLWRISPMDAGLTVQATARLSDLPIGPLAGAAVLVAWTAAALLAGGLLLRRRDV